MPVGNREPSRNPARLRPRVGAWIRAFLPGSVAQLATLVLFIVAAVNGSPVLWISLGLGLAAIIWRVAREYHTRPPTMKFWKDDAGYLLTVRHKRTRELLLQADTTTLADTDL